MRRFAIAALVLWHLAILSALVLGSGCSGLFPKCDDPKHPCPNVQSDYPPGPGFGKGRDAGAD